MKHGESVASYCYAIQELLDRAMPGLNTTARLRFLKARLVVCTGKCQNISRDDVGQNLGWTLRHIQQVKRLFKNEFECVGIWNQTWRRQRRERRVRSRDSMERATTAKRKDIKLPTVLNVIDIFHWFSWMKLITLNRVFTNTLLITWNSSIKASILGFNV